MIHSESFVGNITTERKTAEKEREVCFVFAKNISGKIRLEKRRFLISDQRRIVKVLQKLSNLPHGEAKDIVL